MIPLFKSHFSTGKSILTLSEPEKQKQDGPDSVISLAIENDLKEIYLVEDSLTGFLTAFKSCKAHNIHLKFGLRITVCNSYDSVQTSSHKVILFALNDAGFKQINKIYTLAFVEHEGVIANDDLKSKLTDDILIAIPFYDSFIWNNMYSFSDCMPSFTPQVFFVEDNNLPFDKITAEFIKSKEVGASIIEAKSIYYNKREDFEAWVTYKIACNRRMGKSQTLSAPEINGCGSREFCFESWKEKQ
jgi:DNA polymerase III alpha subunit